MQSLNEIPIFKVYLNGDDDEMIVNSIVDKPAHLRNFVAMKEKKLLFSTNEDKMEVTGVVISANQPIYYYDENLPPCFIVFDANVIKQIALKYFEKGKNNLIDINHDFKNRANAVVMVESYFTDTNKKSQFDVEEGSWVMTYKVLDNELWAKIKANELNGFSIAGNFSLEALTFNSKNMKLTEKIKQMFSGQPDLVDVQTIDGKQMKVEKELAVGNKLYAVAEDGSTILAPMGEYVLQVEDKQVKVVIDELGVIVAVDEVQPTAEPVEQVLQRKVAELEQAIAEVKSTVSTDLTDIKKSIELLAQEFKARAKFRSPEQPEKKDVNNGKVIIN